MHRREFTKVFVGTRPGNQKSHQKPSRQVTPHKVKSQRHTHVSALSIVSVQGLQGRTIETYPCLRVRDLRVGGQWRSQRGRLLWRHREEGHTHVVEWYLHPQARSVRLLYRGPSTLMEEEIVLGVRRQSGFGRIWYFRCGSCGRRCKVLYYVERFACRSCQGLCYRRQDSRRQALYEQLSRNLSEYQGREVRIGMVRRLLHGHSRG